MLIFVSPTFLNKYTGHLASTAENRQARKALKKGYQPIRLGKKILRTETAGIMSAISVNLIHHY